MCMIENYLNKYFYHAYDVIFNKNDDYSLVTWADRPILAYWEIVKRGPHMKKSNYNNIFESCYPPNQSQPSPLS